jgi:hypothetical protein
VAAQSQLDRVQQFRLADSECRSLLARILASREFQRATRLRAFLTYVVDRKLEGHPEEVTEVLIGHRVFARSATYNPGEDSIVRTEARTLRQRLERYFAADGADEPVILEIPRGGYLPVFRPRLEAPAEESKGMPDKRVEEPAGLRLSRRQWLGFAATATTLSGAGLWAWRVTPFAGVNDPSFVPGPAASLQLESSDPRLNVAFERARDRALATVFTADPVGVWYASNRDNRAFCMRDTAHECTGAALLGLRAHTRNMLRRFAASIAKSRDWCGYWIITKDGFPSPLDYNGDDNFNYCLPANFDLLRACCSQLRWTGDLEYLDPVFTAFYDSTVSRYVAAWDSNHDGLMERRPDRPRIFASYQQEPPHFQTGADLVGSQYGAYLAYAAIQEMKGGRGSLSQQMASEYRSKAEALRARFNAEWWDEGVGRFRSGIMPDGSWSLAYAGPCSVYPLKFGIPESGPKTEASLDYMERSRPAFASTYSYYPDVLYRYERNDSAYRRLLEIADPGFSGYEMAETAYAAIGAIGAGLMGIDPDAIQAKVATRPRLAKDLAWVRLANVPVGASRITLEHRGLAESHFSNLAGNWITWQIGFPVPRGVSSASILIDGAAAPKLGFERLADAQVLWASVTVKPGQTRVARLAI